jgi:hypothetical protein
MKAHCARCRTSREIHYPTSVELALDLAHGALSHGRYAGSGKVNVIAVRMVVLPVALFRTPLPASGRRAYARQVAAASPVWSWESLQYPGNQREGGAEGRAVRRGSRPGVRTRCSGSGVPRRIPFSDQRFVRRRGRSRSQQSEQPRGRAPGRDIPDSHAGCSRSSCQGRRATTGRGRKKGRNARAREWSVRSLARPDTTQARTATKTGRAAHGYG